MASLAVLCLCACDSRRVSAGTSAVAAATPQRAVWASRQDVEEPLDPRLVQMLRQTRGVVASLAERGFMYRFTVTRWVLALMLSGAVAPLLACHEPACPPGNDSQDELTDDIGEFQSKDAGIRAAIKRLAVETQKCPETKSYQITWVGPSDENPSEMTSHGWRALVYWWNGRSRMLLGYEHDFQSGTSGRIYAVDRAAIRAVADKGGTLSDFDKYDQSTPEERKKWGD
ncbi:MAG TPA: hypothetical protein VJX67_01915 [Blastocatellia bacterium]|nr:hypothetical protein [Blastocatellia bacterium]